MTGLALGGCVAPETRLLGISDCWFQMRIRSVALGGCADNAVESFPIGVVPRLIPPSLWNLHGRRDMKGSKPILASGVGGEKAATNLDLEEPHWKNPGCTRTRTRNICDIIAPTRRIQRSFSHWHRTHRRGHPACAPEGVSSIQTSSPNGADATIAWSPFSKQHQRGFRTSNATGSRPWAVPSRRMGYLHG